MQEVRRRLQLFLTLFLIVAAIGTVGFMNLENLSLADAFYYNIVTMSTVGYGDIHPTNQTSRMFAVLLIVMGGGTFLGVIANSAEILILKRESKNRIRKVNMVLGVFFSEAGYKLLGLFASHDHAISEIRENLLVNSSWTAGRFTTALKAIRGYKIKTDTTDLDLKELSDFLNSKRDFLLGLIENPVLIEHEDFSDTLLSTFHLLDELSSRNELSALPKSDIQHLTGDINRAYKSMMMQWIVYMRHLKGEYPYLFSLAIRTNPFDDNASPVVID
ncbi:MAG: two pore domain potassium channel family protein [Desulfobacterium sp.]|nr:two pore domain potassium channel family protein [Desulfobacterium sp.]MBU3948139.1 potassium channel family protein [Pseudomonadota bacterium]MBU4010902.1 potassium channel family protein [Pseudomonadota bacterium]MBU4036656.1 potassium channel family protein [Pseudomonadota bacterium]